MGGGALYLRPRLSLSWAWAESDEMASKTAAESVIILRNFVFGAAVKSFGVSVKNNIGVSIKNNFDIFMKNNFDIFILYSRRNRLGIA